MNIEKTVESLQQKGYQVSVFETRADAAAYLNQSIDGKSVGMGGSITLQDLGIYEMLESHNTCYWHWPKSGAAVPDVVKAASEADVYLTSVNGLSENGEMVNIDGTGNRVASTLYGHEKVYFVVGVNKIASDLASAIDRARNIASPLNAKRLGKNTPCAVKGDKCYDCNSPERICNGMVVHFKKMGSCAMEVVLVKETLGY
ncbi:MAG: lactate utilization protein [Firmicutes bacterium]|nr:lactate utilization protein [Bacillota bacterium]